MSNKANSESKPKNRGRRSIANNASEPRFIIGYTEAQQKGNSEPTCQATEASKNTKATSTASSNSQISKTQRQVFGRRKGKTEANELGFSDCTIIIKQARYKYQAS